MPCRPRISTTGGGSGEGDTYGGGGGSCFSFRARFLRCLASARACRCAARACAAPPSSSASSRRRHAMLALVSTSAPSCFSYDCTNSVQKHSIRKAYLAYFKLKDADRALKDLDVLALFVVGHT